MVVLKRSTLQDGSDVVRRQIGVVLEDLIASRTGSQEIQHIPHADAQAADARPADRALRAAVRENHHRLGSSYGVSKGRQ